MHNVIKYSRTYVQKHYSILYVLFLTSLARIISSEQVSLGPAPPAEAVSWHRYRRMIILHILILIFVFSKNDL